MNPMDIKVRTGIPADLDGVMRIALMATEENSLTRASPRKLLEEIWPSLHLDHGIMGVIGDPIEAAILLRVAPMWYSEADDPSLMERAIFVDPEFRFGKIGRAKMLCDFAKEAAVSLGLPLVIGILSNERTEAKSKLYMRQFGEPAGVYFVWNGHTGQKALPA